MAYRRKKSEMACKASNLDRPAADKNVYKAGLKKPAGYRDSLIFLSQDSGYNESLKAFSPECFENCSDSLESKTPKQEFENSENVDPTLVCSPLRSKRFWESETGSNTKHLVTEIYETPRVIKKESSLRRRLLLSKATSGGSLDFDASECSAETCRRKKTLQRVPSFDSNLSNSFVDSPRDTSYKPIATSTLKTEPDSGMSCRKWRLSFAQQRSSTLDESKCDTDPFPEVENLSPVQYPDSTDDSIVSVTEENISEVPATPNCNIITCDKEEFQTPVSNLAANFRFHLCTPTGPPVNDFDNSVTEDSAFHSLSLDKSQDSLTDHEGSFQELIQKQKETPKSTHKNRMRKLERCRRLSTLRERGSQSEVEEECSEKQLLSLSYKSKVVRNSVDEENESSYEDSGTNSLLKIDDLTGTPALRVVHEILVRSTRKRAQQATMLEVLGSLDYSELSEDGLTRLIGRKMGLEKIDILSELKYRNLKHILALIFKELSVESICSIWKVSKEWQEMVLQDKNAYRRRKLFLKRQKVEAERGCLYSSEDATTRLHLLNRSALKSVQAQARFVFHTPTSSSGSLTPKDPVAIHQSASKQQEYVKIAKTLFTDEALKPCPQCQYPAKYQPLKKRGKCSRKDCGFDFCVLCLCPFHGSKECSGGSGKRVNKKDILPGSAQSKRNLKRL